MTVASKTERPFAPEPRIPPDCSTSSRSRSQHTGQPDQPIAVFEIVDDLREEIWSIYQTNLQDLMRQQRQPFPVEHTEIDDDDLPF